MEKIIVPVKRLAGHKDLPLPRYMTPQAAGMDICAALKDDLILNPGERAMVPTGIALSLPDGYEAQLRPRSGLAWKQGVTLVNSPGTIDADYRGEVAVILINHGKQPFLIKRGDRIAQLVVGPVCRVSWQEQEILDETDRGGGGFGHTK